MISGKSPFTLEEYGSDGLELIYRDYERDFPLIERKSFLRLKELLSFGQYRLIVAKARGCNQIRAYVLVLTLFKFNAVWIDYMAVSKSIRGKGFGCLFLDALKEHFKDSADVMFAEVEHVDSTDPKERKAQESRICFYKTNGAAATDIKYELPTCNGGLPMYLYYIPMKKGAGVKRDRIMDSTRYLFKYVHKDIKNISEIYLRIFGEILE